MGLLDKLQKQGSTLTKYDGADPPKAEADLRTSTLHNEYSINGTPIFLGKPASSILDWDGKTPTIIGKYPYLDNLPE
jgi:hypothetical protein